MHYFIYKTTNLVNGKYYIGQHITNDMGDGYIGSGRRLKLAIQKYGRENFIREVIAIAESPEQLNVLEALYVSWKEVNDKNCYNLMTGGGSCGKPSKETRQKMSHSKKNMSAETRKKIGDARKGKKLSAETRQKMSHSKKNMSAETRQKISVAKQGENHPFFGKKFSAETRQKISDSQKGENNPRFKPLSQEARQHLLSMPDFLTATPRNLHSRLHKTHKTKAGPLAISLFQQEMKNFHK